MNGEPSAGGDPRVRPSARSDAGIMPLVARPRAGLSAWAIGGGLAVAGCALFLILETRRQALSAPATFPAATGSVVLRAPPPLYVPPDAPASASYFTPADPVRVPSDATRPPMVPHVRPAVPAAEYTAPMPPPQSLAPPAPRVPRSATGPALVLDAGGAPPAPGTGATADTGGDDRATGIETSRARAGLLSNRSTTVPQGTLIQAVLETAFDSTSPGFARALVQRDVRGFDGTQILIPRGSRLIGQYPAEVAAGQKRVAIVWARLIRPDGVTIALASPASDPVGRGGIRAKVDTHFWERFGGVILQSTFDLGVALAGRGRSQSVVVALPGATSTIANAASPTTSIQPTLRIAAGTSISVFVARDLDFTDQSTAR